MKIAIKFVMVILVLSFAIYKLQKQPVIVYTVDNAGALMVGKVTDKEIIDGKHTLTAEAYGKFLVTKEQYEKIEIGQEIPEFLKGRGS